MTRDTIPITKQRSGSELQTKEVVDISINKLQISERLKPNPLASKNNNAHVAVANISEEEK